MIELKEISRRCYRPPLSALKEGYEIRVVHDGLRIGQRMKMCKDCAPPIKLDKVG